MLTIKVLRGGLLSTLTVLAFCVSNFALAQPDAPARQAERATQTLAVDIQKKVEQLDTQRQNDFHEWRQLRRELLLLEAHNQRQAEWNANLNLQIASLEEQLESLDSTREGLEPLLYLMAERLEGFIQQDLPFRKEERLFHARNLYKLLARVDVSHAEKLRQLLIAYRTEVEQGRALASSQEFLQLTAEAEVQEFTLLRMGRLGLYYLSKDQQEVGYWSAQQQAWLPLGRQERKEILRGLALADERGLPEFLTLPLSIPLRTAANTSVTTDALPASAQEAN